jgi:hypothetical protein
MMTQSRITRDDLESRFRQLQDDVMTRVENRKPSLVKVGITAGVVLVIIIFLLGRRSGNKKTTLVEIRRV